MTKQKPKRIGIGLLAGIGSLISTTSLALGLKGNISSIMVGIGGILVLIGLFFSLDPEQKLQILIRNFFN